MNQIFKTGDKIIPQDGAKTLVIEKFLGGGGQGEVYRANHKGKLMALKWYYPTTVNTAYLKNLERLINKGPPNESFLWPIELVFDPDIEGFGYLMPLRDERYHSIVDLMKRRIEPSFRTLAMVGFNLAHSFLQLHSKGMCYSDISFGNIFLQPDNGNILICDNDNCIFDGEKTAIKGTPRFMAPEVVQGNNPNIQSDLFSLAVLLFYIFYLHHPLEGKKEAAIKCFDLPAMKKLYGSEPVFIFDPIDNSNRPVPGIHNNALIYWHLYPHFFKEAFIRSFTEGIKDPLNGRVRETEWRSIMLKLFDSMIYCPACGSENFFHPGSPAKAQARATCWSCYKPIPLPPALRINQHLLMLNYDTKIYPYHVRAETVFDFSSPYAVVNRHPQNPDIWGLKNTSKEKWVSISPQGWIKDVEPGKSITLAGGTRINFGKIEGVIELIVEKNLN